VLGTSTYKLDLRGGRVLLIHDVLYALDVRQNLLSVTVLLGLGFCLSFKNNGVQIFMESPFMVLALSKMNYCFGYDHIGQERMNKLALEGILDQLAKVSLPTWVYQASRLGSHLIKPQCIFTS